MRLLVVLTLTASSIATASEAPAVRRESLPLSQNSFNQTAQQSAQATPAGNSERERRARAYANLLAGHRYMLDAQRRGGIAEEARERARALFIEAANLDPSLSEAHLALAKIAFLTGDEVEAESRARRAIAADADNLGAQRLLARLFVVRAFNNETNVRRGATITTTTKRFTDLQLSESAIAQLHIVTRLKPDDAESLALLGEVYERANRMEEALAAYRAWISAPTFATANFYEAITGDELNPATAQIRLARLLMRLDRYDEVISVLLSALSAASPDARLMSMLEVALRSTEGAAMTSPLIELRSIVARNPTHAGLVRLLARTEAEQGNADAAVALLRSALNEKNVLDHAARRELLIEVGDTYRNATRFPEAIAAFESAYKIISSPTFAKEASDSDEGRTNVVEILERLLDIHRSQGDWQAADETLARLGVLLGNQNPSLTWQRITGLRAQGKYDEALSLIRSARTRFPEQHAFTRIEAITLADTNRVDDGVALLRAATTKNTDPLAAPLLIANLYVQAGQARNAISLLSEILPQLSAQPAREIQALLLLASAQEASGEKKAAEATLRQVLAREPRNAIALNNLGYFFVERGERLREAADLIRRAVRLEPYNASFQDSLGWALFKLGRHVDAQRHLTDAARRNPISATIQEHIGDLHNALGNSHEAQAAWRRALALSNRRPQSERITNKLNTLTKRS